jgi:hypothetical protein
MTSLSFVSLRTNEKMSYIGCYLLYPVGRILCGKK